MSSYTSHYDSTWGCALSELIDGALSNHSCSFIIEQRPLISLEREGVDLRSVTERTPYSNKSWTHTFPSHIIRSGNNSYFRALLPVQGVSFPYDSRGTEWALAQNAAQNQWFRDLCNLPQFLSHLASQHGGSIRVDNLSSLLQNYARWTRPELAYVLPASSSFYWPLDV